MMVLGAMNAVVMERQLVNLVRVLVRGIQKMEYVCDDCGEVFELGPGTYLGSLDTERNRCNPHLTMTALCESCYSVMHEMEMENG